MAFAKARVWQFRCLDPSIVDSRHLGSRRLLSFLLSEAEHEQAPVLSPFGAKQELCSARRDQSVVLAPPGLEHLENTRLK